MYISGIGYFKPGDLDRENIIKGENKKEIKEVNNMGENFVMVNKSVFFYLLDNMAFNQNTSNSNTETNNYQDTIIKDKVKRLFNQCARDNISYNNKHITDE